MIKLNADVNLHIMEAAEVAARAAAEFINTASDAIKHQGRFFVALSGGTEPAPFMQILGREQASLQLAWDKIHVFWVDERAVPPESSKSNYGLAARTFLDATSIPSQNVHPMPADANDLDHAAAQYQQTIMQTFDVKPPQVPQFDLIYLGMGPDAHTASLFPHAENCTGDELVCAVTRPEQMDRLTMSPRLLTRAKKLIMLIVGEQKAHALKKVLTTEPDTEKYPVHHLWPALDRLHWFVTPQAAKYLT